MEKIKHTISFNNWKCIFMVYLCAFPIQRIQPFSSKCVAKCSQKNKPDTMLTHDGNDNKRDNAMPKEKWEMTNIPPIYRDTHTHTSTQRQHKTRSTRNIKALCVFTVFTGWARNILYNKSFLFSYRKVRNLLFLILGHHIISLYVCRGTYTYTIRSFSVAVAVFFSPLLRFFSSFLIQFTEHYSSRRMAFKCCFFSVLNLLLFYFFISVLPLNRSSCFNLS